MCRVSLNHTIISFLWVRLFRCRRSCRRRLFAAVAFVVAFVTLLCGFFFVVLFALFRYTHSFIYVGLVFISRSYVSVCMGLTTTTTTTATNSSNIYQPSTSNDDCCDAYVCMQTCVRKQYDDQLTFTINTPIFSVTQRTHMRAGFVPSCRVHVAYGFFGVCVTDDAKIRTNNSINTIVNCINCILLTTLAPVTNTWQSVQMLKFSISNDHKTAKTIKMLLAHGACSKSNRKFALISNLLILKGFFSFASR